jgi:hypothetical protein
MGILDEAIREHLELKRAHGADDSELKQLEDQAFGAAERPGGEAAPSVLENGGDAPDPAAEAPTEFMAQPDLGDAAPQEAPPARREPAAGVGDIQEAPEKSKEPEEQSVAAEEERPAPEERDEPPAVEEQPAAEHEAIPSAAEHSTEERHAIADQPTQMYDVEEEFAATEAPAPPDEDIVAEEMTEARLGPAEPLPTPEPSADDEDEDDDFFDEQRLSDELDQALEAPIDPEPEPASDEHEAVAPRTEEQEAPVAEKGDNDEDVLEETPDFLEETPEDDELWFEQKPPKDFDFDD